MTIRFSNALASTLLAAAGLAGFSTAIAQSTPPVREDRVFSTRNIGQPAANGERVLSTTSLRRDNARDPEAEAVRQRFLQRFSDVTVTAVRHTPYGLFEVQLGGMDLVYTDKDVNWVMEGPMIDAQTRRDLTRESLEKISAIEFDKLPFDLAIKQVKGDGSRKVAVFEDPNCGYCKQMRKTMEDVDNLTVYTFLFPILSPDSTVKVSNVWCAEDRGAVWDDWMLRGKTPPARNCDVPIEKMLELGHTLSVRGTPTIFFQNGVRAGGALPLKAFNERLEQAQ